MEEYPLIETLGIVGIMVGLFCLLIWALLWWVIFKKAGFPYSLLLGILMAIPLINIVLFLIFAFGEWPILRNEKLK